MFSKFQNNFVYFQTTFKIVFKICLIFSHNIKNFQLSQIWFKILQISKTFEYGLYIISFIFCWLSTKILATSDTVISNMQRKRVCCVFDKNVLKN